MRRMRRCVIAAVTLLFMSGCIGLKTGPVETIVKSREPIKKVYTIQADNGITAKLTPDRGQMFMELWWWNKRVCATTFREHKQEAIFGTSRIGLFPGMGATNDGIGGDLFLIPVANVILVGVPTMATLLFGPFVDYDSFGGESILAAGYVGTYKYRDTKDPKILNSFDGDVVEQKAEEDPIRLMNFDVEINGKVFHGEKGIAYVGSVVGDKTALDVKVVSFEPPEGFATNDVSSIFGYSFRAKVPTAAEIAAEVEKKRLESLAKAAEAQARQEADAAADAARRAAALAILNASVQNANAAAAAAASAPTTTRVVTPAHKTSTVTTPTVSKPIPPPKVIHKPIITPRAPSFGYY